MYYTSIYKVTIPNSLNDKYSKGDMQLGTGFTFPDSGCKLGWQKLDSTVQYDITPQSKLHCPSVPVRQHSSRFLIP